MRALDPEVFDAVYAATEPILPPRPDDHHPLGCHRRRVSDRICLWAMLVRLVTGCSWVDAERLVGGVSDTTLRSRRDEWVAAGVFDCLRSEALDAYDRVIGLDLSEVALDGSLHKAPCGGDGTGKSPVDRGKLGWKWSVAADANGIPVGIAIDGANRNDVKLLAPTLEDVAAQGLLLEIETLHLDRSYDFPKIRAELASLGLDDVCIQRRGTKGSAVKQSLTLGLRWVVEGTNSWFSNFGQMRRNTDRRSEHRRAQLCFVIALLITARLIDWRNRWSPRPAPIR